MSRSLRKILVFVIAASLMSIGLLPRSAEAACIVTYRHIGGQIYVCYGPGCPTSGCYLY